MSQEIGSVQHTDNGDGTVTLQKEIFDLVVEQRNQSLEDITFTVEKITRLLKDLGILTDKNEFKFSLRVLSSTLRRFIISPSKMEEEFRYLAELEDIIHRYAGMNVNQPLLNQIPD